MYINVLSLCYALAAQIFCTKELILWLWRYLNNLHILVEKLLIMLHLERLKNKTNINYLSSVMETLV
jgi:hypothetical protein